MADELTLVTGASGFLGHAIMKLLDRDGRRAIGLDPVPSATADIIDDLSDRPRLKALLADKNVTHIIHAGGVSGPMVMADDPIGIIAINVAGNLNLLRAAMEAGVKTFIYCSSVSALGDFYESQPVGEDYPLRPNSTTAPQKPRWTWCCAGSGAESRWICARCALQRSMVHGDGLFFRSRQSSMLHSPATLRASGQ
jgi:nucleoside-diphosphate-sugar epimerase